MGRSLWSKFANQTAEIIAQTILQWHILNKVVRVVAFWITENNTHLEIYSKRLAPSKSFNYIFHNKHEITTSSQNIRLLTEIFCKNFYYRHRLETTTSQKPLFPFLSLLPEAADGFKSINKIKMVQPKGLNLAQI